MQARRQMQVVEHLQEQEALAERRKEQFGPTGKDAGVLGGRPPVPTEDGRGVWGSGGDAFNILPLGAQRRRPHSRRITIQHQDMLCKSDSTHHKMPLSYRNVL